MSVSHSSWSIAGVCLVGLALALAFSCQSGTSAQESLILRVRDRSNAAIAAHDTAAMAQTLTEDYNVVTSRNSVSSTRKVMLDRLAADMAAKPDLIYQRTPDKIQVFDAWQMASETGNWTGSWTEPNGDKIQLSGTYYAKWHRVDNRWLIRAEIFTPLTCTGGAYCDSSPLGK